MNIRGVLMPYNENYCFSMRINERSCFSHEKIMIIIAFLMKIQPTLVQITQGIAFLGCFGGGRILFFLMILFWWGGWIRSTWVARISPRTA